MHPDRELAAPDEGRRRVHEELRRHDGPLHPAVIAARVGLHVSTVRRHLQVLEAAGLVERVEEPPDGPGRPRVCFGPATAPPRLAVCAAYRFIADSLARWVEDTAEDPRDAAARMGDAWGRYFAHAPPLSHVPREEAIAQLLAVLDGLGYEQTEVTGEGRELRLGRCPLASLAAHHPAIGCGMHLGIVRGVLDGLGADVEVGEFHPSPDGSVRCRIELRERA